MKAIIEIDDEYAKYYDVENLYAEIYAYGDVRPQETFVSLKPLPKKMGTTDDGNLETFILEGFSRGWNSCLEELEKLETKSDLSTDDGWWRDYELYEMQND